MRATLKLVMFGLAEAGSLTRAAVSSAHSTPEYLEPNVQRHVGVIPTSICEQLIELGESAGFNVMVESIDRKEQDDNLTYVPSQTINVYGKGYTEQGPATWRAKGYIPENKAIWDLLQPWIPKITNIVKANRDREALKQDFPDDPDTDPELIWVFFRRYSPDDDRNSLKQHLDTNMNTVNIELSNDYEGGGLFYIKPEASTGLISEDYYGYEWTNSVKRENTTDIIFPDLHAGDAIFYNFTVHHAVAPIESGSRYSMAFFYDDPNQSNIEIHNALPDTELDVVLRYDAPGEIEEWEKIVVGLAPHETVNLRAFEGDVFQTLVTGTDTLVTKLKIHAGQNLYEVSHFDNPNEFGVRFHNLLPGTELDFVLIYDAAEGKVWDRMLHDIVYNETVIYHAYDGDVLWAMVAGTDTVVAEIEIMREKHLYEVSNFDSPIKFGVTLQNMLPDMQVDIVLVYDAAAGKDVSNGMWQNLYPNEEAFFNACEGDVVRATVAGTETVASEIEIKSEQHLYTISQVGSLLSEL